MSIISKAIYGITIKAGAVVESKFNRLTRNCQEENEKALLRILKINKDTEIGKKYNFKDIKSIKEFKNKIPITDYSNYEEYMKRMAKGEKNILIKEEVEYFGHTSGTTGKQKLIPSTKTARHIAAKYMACLANRFAYKNFKNRWNYGRGLMIADIVMTTYTEGKIPICSATSGGMKYMEKILPYMYTSPIEVMKIKDKECALYLHLLFALKERDLLFISSVFVSNILDLLRILEEKNKDLVLDIRKGIINRKLPIDQYTRKKLNEYLKPDAARADFLENEFRSNFKGICRRVWPSLSYFLCVTGANFSIYDDKVNYYSDNLPIYSPGYAATEAMIGINPNAYEIKYIVLPDTAFYEFIPADYGEDKEICSIDEVKKGSKYEIVVTTYSGLYRYKLGDVVEVTGFYNKSPEIRFLYRKNQVLNMVSEKTTEQQLAASIRNTISKLNLNLVDYTTMPDNSITPGRYVVYMELRGKKDIKSVIKIENILDNELQKSNLAYGRFRKNKRLSNLKVVVLEDGAFSEIKEALFCEGVSKNQIKIPRVLINNPKILEIIGDKKYKAAN